LISENYPSDLKGDYQVYNQKTVLQTIELLNAQEEFIITRIILNGSYKCGKTPDFKGDGNS
jgi:hypothetical protein